ncbi:MAG: hypothetical protein SGILL_000718 [Bacillariaceae sp.]
MHVLPDRVKDRLVNELDKRLDLDIDSILESPKLQLQLAPAALDQQLLYFYKNVTDGPTGDVLRVIAGGQEVALQDFYIKSRAAKKAAKDPKELEKLNFGPFQALGDESDEDGRTASQWVNSVLRRTLPKNELPISHSDEDKKKDDKSKMSMSLLTRPAFHRPKTSWAQHADLLKSSFTRPSYMGRSMATKFSEILGGSSVARAPAKCFKTIYRILTCSHVHLSVTSLRKFVSMHSPTSIALISFFVCTTYSYAFLPAKQPDPFILFFSKLRGNRARTPHSCTAMSKNSSAQDQVNIEWNAMAGEWDDLASSYRDGFLKLLGEHTKLDLSKPRTVVDFGCGSGLLTDALRRLSSAESTKSRKFVCIDAAPAMIRTVQDKIQSGGWDDVQAFAVALASYEAASDSMKNEINALKGTVDLVVASSVMSFVPAEDLPSTMKVLGDMLRPGGIFCHSDWPLNDDNPSGFTEEKASEMYRMGGLDPQSSTVVNMDMGGGHKGDVFVGVAVKPFAEESI